MKSIYAVATMDTKGEELAFVASCLRNVGLHVLTVDVSTRQVAKATPDVPRSEVWAFCDGEDDFRDLDRGSAVTAMGEALRKYLLSEVQNGHVAGVIGIGGSGGTSLITCAMRALEIGLPKLMVSTVASGNTAPYVGCSDLTMMHSVVDVAGLNSVSRQVLGNAAHAMAGMVSHSMDFRQRRTTVGMTMFGVTTPCIDEVRNLLEVQGNDCLVFHATGTGGRAMEQLVESAFIDGVIDATTTEVADEVVGGVFPCGPRRFDRVLSSGVPFVLSLGAVDMVNFGAMETVPEKFQDRRFHVHNAQVSLMRTSPEENRQIARWIAEKLNQAQTPCVVLIPEQGVSMLDAPGQPFHDPIADEALFSELEQRIQQDDIRRIVRLPLHINDAAFASALVKYYKQLTDFQSNALERK